MHWVRRGRQSFPPRRHRCPRLSAAQALGGTLRTSFFIQFQNSEGRLKPLKLQILTFFGSKFMGPVVAHTPESRSKYDVSDVLLFRVSWKAKVGLCQASPRTRRAGGGRRGSHCQSCYVLCSAVSAGNRLFHLTLLRGLRFLQD